MTLTRTHVILAAAGGSLAILLAGWGFQYIGGLAPCQLCIWQRWPHAAAVAIGVAGLGAASALVPLLGAGAAATTGGIGIYHTGVERGWWPGPSGCAAPDISGLTPEELLNQIMAAPVVRCDEVAWEIFGLSMASWNAVASFTLAGLWLFALRFNTAR